MKIRFHINYHTEWGESLFICGAPAQLGGDDDSKAVEMELAGPDLWVCETELPDGTPGFSYRFIVKAPEKAWRFEWGAPHVLRTGKGIGFYNVFDSWHSEPAEKPYYSSAFVDGMLNRTHRDQEPASRPGTLTLRVFAPMVAPDEVLALSGEGEALGNWDPAQAVRMNDSAFPLWEASVPLSGLRLPFEYKFVVLDRKTLEPHVWENCRNRIFNIRPQGAAEQIMVDGLTFANPRNDWKGAGTAVPVFSLRTRSDWGVGEFLDLKQMVDWCVRTGQKMLQILPINDTTKTGTWVDSYPYSANSIFALHPMYVRPAAIGRLRDAGRCEYYETQGRRLNQLPQIDYEEVNALKNNFLREIYLEKWEETSRNGEYQEFYRANEEWLRPYAVWSVLRDSHASCDNTIWGEMATYDAELVDAFIASNRDKVSFYYFVQYHLDRQLREVREYAHQHGVVLKGDIPIGVGRFSVDAWQNARLFNMDSQAGAPPDDFSVMGQNWGFPTYNWEEMARDGFAWWKRRFRKMAEYFDAYRIDHILGFFRIWEIPLDAVHGLLGHFNPALPFSPEELRNNYDFWINPERQCRPQILEWMLTDFFGDYTGDAKNAYLDEIEPGRYRLRDFVDTQRKVQDHFATLERNPKNDRMRDALLGLLDDVLFIEDPVRKGHYHPRISAQFTYQFRCLTDYEKWTFNRLYNDFFYHRHNDFWYGKAMWKLPPLLDSTRMLTCGEDLGMIPDCVPEVMRRLQILSLEIQRMPKDPTTEFGDTWHYPYQSVCTTSTHDMPGIRGWWESDRAQTQRYFNEVLHEGGEAPYFAEPWVCRKIVELQLKSPSMLCILPLQDWLSTDGDLRRENPAEEQINEPANPTHYWRYRMHLDIERLLGEDAFNDSLRQLIADASR